MKKKPGPVPTCNYPLSHLSTDIHIKLQELYRTLYVHLDVLKRDILQNALILGAKHLVDDLEESHIKNHCKSLLEEIEKDINNSSKQ